MFAVDALLCLRLSKPYVQSQRLHLLGRQVSSSALNHALCTRLLVMHSLYLFASLLSR